MNHYLSFQHLSKEAIMLVWSQLEERSWNLETKNPVAIRSDGDAQSVVTAIYSPALLSSYLFYLMTSTLCPLKRSTINFTNYVVVSVDTLNFTPRLEGGIGFAYSYHSKQRTEDFAVHPIVKYAFTCYVLQLRIFSQVLLTPQIQIYKHCILKT